MTGQLRLNDPKFCMLNNYTFVMANIVCPQYYTKPSNQTEGLKSNRVWGPHLAKQFNSSLFSFCRYETMALFSPFIYAPLYASIIYAFIFEKEWIRIPSK